MLFGRKLGVRGVDGEMEDKKMPDLKVAEMVEVRTRARTGRKRLAMTLFPEAQKGHRLRRRWTSSA